MAKDELTRPLGLTPRPKPRRLRLLLIAAATIVVIGVGAAGLWQATSARLHGTDGPTATATIAPAKAPDTTIRTAAIPAKPSPPPAPVAAPANPGSGLSEVKPTGSLTELGKVVIYDPALPTPIALPAKPDQTLVENSAYGPIPRTAVNGLRPLDAYARPPSSGGGARIAIVVGGVGVDPATTKDAILTLPGSVTLALAPYAANLNQTLADARAVGHELLLQIPLEPFGYPTTDPGPHTLTTAATAKANLDNLSWLLSRTTNYVGVVNYMGGRFTSETQSMQTLLDAVGQRGLLYLDDGSSPRSLAADLAPGHAPFLKADVVLDPELTAAAIDAKLDQLVSIARSRGYAVGTASAFPASIERIAAFAKAAAAHDVTLVPVSALVTSASRT
jgi:polysaccharide deacetylase 2 family uncharacterized protein YibQ